MTPQTQAEKKARELLHDISGGYSSIVKYHEVIDKITLLIQKAAERDMVVNNSATSSQIGQIIAERDSYKEKADALDWLDKQMIHVEIWSNEKKEFKTLYSNAMSSCRCLSDATFSAIQQAQK